MTEVFIGVLKWYIKVEGTSYLAISIHAFFFPSIFSDMEEKKFCCQTGANYLKKKIHYFSKSMRSLLWRNF